MFSILGADNILHERQTFGVWDTWDTDIYKIFEMLFEYRHFQDI